MFTARPHIVLLAVALACWTPMAALAGPDYAGQVTTQLLDQGYRRIEVRRTLLGRVVITAEGNGHTREVVIDPRSGSLLRDLVRQDEDGTTTLGIAVMGDDGDSSGSGSVSVSGSGSGSDDDSDSDDGDSGSDDDDDGSDSGSDDDSDSDDSGSDDSGSDDDDSGGDDSDGGDDDDSDSDDDR
ncbi:hypothetical protein [Paracoccus sp. M683]|uniref:hypothetical protein n=1 Tax=Paracoccus sp. M683 TaxID=2594268 RepID=UPI00163D3DE5|nr:hypothetical protein [Paracoccus sp. M683]